jgi:membrane fusion protein (multidrug efflux system)
MGKRSRAAAVTAWRATTPHEHVRTIRRQRYVNTTFHNILSRSAGVAGAVALALLAGCGTPKTGTDQGATGDAKNTVPVEVAAVQQGTLAVGRTYAATLEGLEQANIVPKISERIAAVHVHVGMSVPENQVILSLDKAGASSQFFQAEAGYRNAEKSLERMKSLYAEGAVSLQTLDATQTAYDVARANFVAARSTVELITPIAGVVTAVNANAGDLAIPGAPLATVAQIGRMKAIFNLNETDVTAIAPGQMVRITSEARPDLSVSGTIVQISRSADVRSRSFEVQALFANTPDRWFRPGMFARVHVQVSSRAAVLMVPNAAIQTDGITSRVFVVRNGRAYQRTVQVGMTDGERTAILQGVFPADSVATVGISNVHDSSYVIVTQQADAR